MEWHPYEFVYFYLVKMFGNKRNDVVKMKRVATTLVISIKMLAQTRSWIIYRRSSPQRVFWLGLSWKWKTTNSHRETLPAGCIQTRRRRSPSLLPCKRQSDPQTHNALRGWNAERDKRAKQVCFLYILSARWAVGGGGDEFQINWWRHW